VRNYYLRHILIKILNPASLNEAKMRIAEAITHLKTAQGIGKLVVYADVDPAG
jgi:ribosomal protein L35AE/L33A